MNSRISLGLCSLVKRGGKTDERLAFALPMCLRGCVGQSVQIVSANGTKKAWRRYARWLDRFQRECSTILPKPSKRQIKDEGIWIEL